MRLRRHLDDFSTFVRTSTVSSRTIGAEILLLSGVPDTSPAAAWSVGSDGSVIGGAVSGSTFTIAAVWTASRGFIPVGDYLALNGVLLPEGFTIGSSLPLSISANGRTIGGAGYSTLDQAVRGWLATIPAPGTFLLSIPIFAVVLAHRRR